MTDFRLFLDSGIWLGYFLGNIPESKTIINSERATIFTSIISIHEIFKKLGKYGKTEKEAMQAIEFVEDNSITINLSKEIAIKAANYCNKYGLHTIDALIYSSAMEKNTLFITTDNDFGETPKTNIIPTK